MMSSLATVMVISEPDADDALTGEEMEDKLTN